MNKSILITVLLGSFALIGNDVLAQNTKAISKIEKTTIDAIKTIKDDKTLSDADKEKFIKRLSDLSSSAKSDNKKTEADLALDYNRIASNYARITNKSLPVLAPSKAVN